MTYGQVRDYALQLIHQYSIAGTITPGSYNNQQDYLNRIPHLVDDAQYYIATTAKKIPVTVPLESLPSREEEGVKIYTLPDNFWQFSGGGLLQFFDNNYGRFDGYRLIGQRDIIVLGAPKGQLWVEYYRYPDTVGTAPSDDTELDNAPETHSAVAVYVAAHLVMGNDSYVHSTLYNEFENKLARMGELPTAEVTPVADKFSTLYGWSEF